MIEADDEEKPEAMPERRSALPEPRAFLGTEVHPFRMPDVIAVCDDAIRNRERLMIGVVNAAKIVKMRLDEILQQSVEDSDIVLADGMSVVWASRVLGEPLPERVTGIDLFTELLALADRESYSVYFLGAKPEVVETVVRLTRERHPNLRVAGYRNGYFGDDEAAEVAQAIGDADPDMLFVAMTTPMKELFLARYADTLRARIRHGVGGSFDVMAGVVSRAPQIWQDLGLEWLHRVLQEPGRMWRRYLVTNSLFLGMVSREWVQRRLGRIGS